MTHPYKTLPDAAFWRRSVSEPRPQDVDPVTQVPWRIRPTDKVVTAGSCFAQHIARRLSQAGFRHFVTEPAHPLAAPDAEAFNYGVYSARYGNIYTPRQLVQLVDRAEGRFAPEDDIWSEPGGIFVDPFRPQIQPNGFSSLSEYHADRRKHFKAVVQALSELDVMVFTLGLTETWRSKRDGAVYPLCPGVAGGVFDPALHEFHNFSMLEIVADLNLFFSKLKKLNPNSKVLLTVSPVPLVATAAGRHVLEATVYSKSVLRVACSEVAAQWPGTVYFPSYEIITGAFSRGAYFAEDLRSVTEAGVDHVMGAFLRHFADAPGVEAARARPQEDIRVGHVDEMVQLVEVMCDEVALDR